MSFENILVIGSGPIVIGQSAEFDYAGVQAVLSIRELGHKAIVLNSNPATIMTDKAIADKVYIEPISLDTIEEIIKKERITGIMATFGGQTGLNMAYKLSESGILEKYGVKLLGTQIDTIKIAEDRKLFRDFLISINEAPIESDSFTNLENALEFAKKIRFPVMIRAAYTLGGTGSGIANNKDEFIKIASIGLNASAIGQILVEKSLYGWKEIEYEMLRDSHGTCIAICNMENIDPVGVHTGESIVVTPSQTLDDQTYQKLRSLSIKIVNGLKIEGACNVQIALSPDHKTYYVIEVNPRLSRSSALASKATGYPIAKIAAQIALGNNLHEIKNLINKNSSAACEPVIDYVVVKIPKWNFEKLKVENAVIGTQMQSTGEVMAIDHSFEGAMLKGLEATYGKDILTLSLKQNPDLGTISIPNAARILQTIKLLLDGESIDSIHNSTRITKWFLEKIASLAMQIKKQGALDEAPIYKKIDGCSGEFVCNSNYFYSARNGHDELAISDRDKIIVIGSGPIAIGQGLEFDYSCVRMVNAIKKIGMEAVILNNNPETLSTDFDVADYLFFDPIQPFYLQNLIKQIKPKGVVFQCGGQAGLNLAFAMKDENIPILGTSIQSLTIAEDRDMFRKAMNDIEVLYPKSFCAQNIDELCNISEKLQYPVILRPSFVIGGRGIEVVQDKLGMDRYISNTLDIFFPVVIDHFIQGKEVEIDAISDGNDVVIPAILEHIEPSGVHSGDSIAVYPDNLDHHTRLRILDITRKICQKLQIIGYVNIQFVIRDGDIYTIEVNPRASRTVPKISKIMDVDMAGMALSVMLGEKLKNSKITDKKNIHAAKIPVFSTHKIPAAKRNLSAEMKSTGEVLGLGKTQKEALYKAFKAAGYPAANKSKILVIEKNHEPELQSWKNLDISFAKPDPIPDLREYNIIVNLSERDFDTHEIGSGIYFSNLETFKCYLQYLDFALNNGEVEYLSLDNWLVL